ncbi:hypothetical protein D3C71_691660 [compost metagenome]
MISRRSFRFQFRNQHFDRHFLMRKYIEQVSLEVFQQGLKCTIGLDPRSYYCRIHKITNHSFQFSMQAIGNGYSNHNILLFGVSVKQNVKDRKHGHKYRNTGFLRKVTDFLS